MTSSSVSQLHYEVIGPDHAPTLVLIQGLGLSALAWPSAFIEHFLSHGYRLVLIDNRDCGLSPIYAHLPNPSLGRLILNKALGVDSRLYAPYQLDDMANDVVAVLDDLNIERAHVVGISMGGMIAQLLAIAYPHRVSSLTSIMSTTGERRASMPKAKLLRLLMRPRPEVREQRIAEAFGFWQLLSSPGYPTDHNNVLERLNQFYDRGYHPQGTMRQLAAIISAKPRFAALQQCNVPALVLHGSHDPLVPLIGGRRTAAALRVPLKIYKGMGHELPPELDRVVAADITEHLTRSMRSTYSE